MLLLLSDVSTKLLQVNLKGAQALMMLDVFARRF